MFTRNEITVCRKLGMLYEGSNNTVITDEKWFSCIIEQILSNAIKYTKPEGTISITLKNDVLCITDTEIGISSEDIPRIFEKGFTGNNGRIDKSSTGLGLYLCKKAADLLGVSLRAESTVGTGTCFYIGLVSNKTGY